jgi:hypothetical protein
MNLIDMFKFISSLSQLLIPIMVIAFSIITMLPESSIHIDVLRNDKFYNKVASQVTPNIFNLNDNMLSKLGITFTNRDTLSANQDFVNTIKSRIDNNRIETVVKESIEMQLKNVETSFKSSSNNSIKDGTIWDKAQYYTSQLYSYRLLLLGLILLSLVFILILTLFVSNKHFLEISKFYLGLSKNMIILTLLAFIGLTGWSFVGSISREFAKNVIGINTISVELLDIINWQWVKFVTYLLIPSLGFTALTISLTVLFGFMSLFQRDNKKIEQLKDQLNRPQSTNTELSDIVTHNHTQNHTQNHQPSTSIYSVIEPLDINTSNKPITIPEPKMREDLDPFLNRLSQSIGNSNTEDEQDKDDIVKIVNNDQIISSNKTKIKLNQK